MPSIIPSLEFSISGITCSLQSCSNGIFAIAQPDAVVISVFKVHIIPDGDAPLDLSAKIEYAPTLLPTAYGKINILSFRNFPHNS